MITLEEAKTELIMCINHEDEGFCGWGECNYCGVPNLIIKMSTKLVVEGTVQARLAVAMINELGSF